MLAHELVNYCDNLMRSQRIQDCCPNGLQVQGRTEIRKIITGVTACQALLDAAIQKKADAILVHHGYFWKDDSPCVTGMQYQRLKALLTHDINLLAYHLPLDVLPVFGNNIQLARALDIKVTGEISTTRLPGLLLRGELTHAMRPEELMYFINERLNTTALHITGGHRSIKKVAWCTGASHMFLLQCFEVDAYLTGEISERTVHAAREMHIDCYACGHHATERLGIRALGEHLAKTFDLSVEFVDVPNPV